MPMLKTTRKGLSWILTGSLFSLIVGLGCGTASDLDPKDCCKNMCQHSGDSKDSNKCCRENRQSKPSLGVPLADLTLAKKVFDSVLLDSHPLANWFVGVLLTESAVPPAQMLKLPQPEIYKLTSALLI